MLQCLQCRKVKLGPDHPETLATMIGLAQVYKNQGRYEEAETLYLQCLEGRKVKLGADYCDTLASMNGWSCHSVQ